MVEQSVAFMPQTDCVELVQTKAEQVIQALVQVLADLGWKVVDRGELALTAELTGANYRCFTAIITCIPMGEKTELLLSVCGSGAEDSAPFASSIVANLRHYTNARSK